MSQEEINRVNVDVLRNVERLLHSNVELGPEFYRQMRSGLERALGAGAFNKKKTKLPTPEQIAILRKLGIEVDESGESAPLEYSAGEAELVMKLIRALGKLEESIQKIGAVNLRNYKQVEEHDIEQFIDAQSALERLLISIYTDFDFFEPSGKEVNNIAALDNITQQIEGWLAHMERFQLRNYAHELMNSLLAVFSAVQFCKYVYFNNEEGVTVKISGAEKDMQGVDFEVIQIELEKAGERVLAEVQVKHAAEAICYSQSGLPPKGLENTDIISFQNGNSLIAKLQTYPPERANSMLNTLERLMREAADNNSEWLWLNMPRDFYRVLHDQGLIPPKGA